MPKELKPYHDSYRLEMFKKNFTVVVASDYEEGETYLRENVEGFEELPECNQRGDAWAVLNPNYGGVIILRRNDCRISYIAHEITHVAICVLHTAGHRINGIEEEIYPYLIEQLMRFTLDTLKRNKTHIKVI